MSPPNPLMASRIDRDYTVEHATKKGWEVALKTTSYADAFQAFYAFATDPEADARLTCTKKA